MGLNPVIAQLAIELARNEKAIREIRSLWEGEVPKGKLSAHVGPMASGASVIADDAAARDVVLQHKDLMAIEMEAYAVMAAAEYSSGRKPIALAIKSVCDYADCEKDDNWQNTHRSLAQDSQINCSVANIL